MAINGKLPSKGPTCYNIKYNSIVARHKQGLSLEIRQAMMPYYKGLLMADEALFQKQEVSHQARISIKSILEDEEDDIWHQLSSIDIVECAQNWASRLRPNNRKATEFISLMLLLFKSSYNTQWDDMDAKIRKQLSRAKECSDYKELEMYCIVMAFLLVHQSTKLTKQEKFNYYDQIAHEWEFLKYMYSIMLKHIVGTKLHDFAGVAGTLVNFKSKHPYMHIAYKAFKENFDKLCPADQKNPMTHQSIRDEAKKQLQEMEDIIKRTHKSDEITPLCKILFSKKMEDVLKQYRPKTYEELEQDIVDLNTKYEDMVKKMVVQFSSSVSIDEIEEAFSMFNADLALSFFSTINTLLAQNETWRKYAPQVQQHILERQAKEKLESAQALALALNQAIKPQTIVNKFEKDSCHFGSGSSMNGNVNFNE